MPSKRHLDGSKPAAASGMLEQKQGVASDERPSDLSSNVDCATDNEYKCPAPLGSNMDEHTGPEARPCDMPQPVVTSVACNALAPVVAKAVASGSRPDLELPSRRHPSVPVLDAPTAVAGAVEATSWPRPREEFESTIRGRCTWVDVQARGGDWWPSRIVATSDDSVEICMPAKRRVFTTRLPISSRRLPISSGRLQPHMSHTPPRLQSGDIEAGMEVDLYCFSCNEWHEAVIAKVSHRSRKIRLKCACSYAVRRRLKLHVYTAMLCRRGCYTGSNPTHTWGTRGSHLEPARKLLDAATEACAGGELLLAASKRWTMKAW